MAFPFDKPPKELRGLSLNVTFWVRPDGRVERYLVEPQIKDRDYAKKFDEVMRAFRFTPARAPDGTFIPGTARISFTLPGKSSSLLLQQSHLIPTAATGRAPARLNPMPPA